MMNEANITNSLLNLSQIFDNLYQLKFRGRKTIEKLSDICYEKDLIVEHRNQYEQRNLFDAAIKNACQKMGEVIAEFEEGTLISYDSQVSKIRDNISYLQSARSILLKQNQGKSLTQANKLLIHELIQLGIDIGESYLLQRQLVCTCSHLKLFDKNGPYVKELKELSFHIGFQTHVCTKKKELFKEKLIMLNNQRYKIKL